MAAFACQLSVGVAARRLIVGCSARQLLIMLGMLKWRCEPPQAGETFARCASHGTDDRQQARTGHVLVGGLNWSSRVSHSDRVRRSFRACTIETVKSKYEDHLLSELGPRPGTVSGTYKRHVAARPVLFFSQVTVTFVQHAIPILPRRRSAGCDMR